MPLYICSLPNPGEPGAPHECIADDPRVIEAFARREDKPGRGVYDCVSPLRLGARRRSLETVGEIVALHVDVDGKDLVEDLATIDARLTTLPLPPSEVRNSGRGRHVVYALKEPIDAKDADGVAQVTDLLRRLTFYLCGDMAVAHHAALLRRPGTHNSKGGTWIECAQTLVSNARYDPGDIADFLDDVADLALFTRKTAGNGRDKSAAHFDQSRPPINVEARLAAMQFEGAGEASIHQTQLSVTASLLRTGVALEETVRQVLEATRATVADDPRTAKWNWRREERKIRRMGAAFINKNPELVMLLPDGTQAASKTKDVREGGLASVTLAEVHAVFKKWFGENYDTDVIDAVLAAAGAERLAGDPLWLLVISGPGNTKTETVQSLSGAGAHVSSTISSEGALLSASPRKSRAKTATGGLLRKIGNRGILVIKDVTSILSADRNTRAGVLAALREVYDGRWERNVGTDGGQTLTWTGRIAVVGAVTTAWDTAHAVVSVMGDRFVSIRSDSTVGRGKAGIKAIRNTGRETAMRTEIVAAVGGLIGHIEADKTWPLEDDEIEQLVKAADIVTYTRTAVERDFRGDVMNSHAPEMPTRFAKQLAQMVRGSLALGMARQAALRLALRCAADSVPQLRIEILLDLATSPRARAIDVSRNITKPYRTVRRELEALHMLGLLRCDEEQSMVDETKTVWRYSLAAGFDRETLLTMSRLRPPKPVAEK